MRVQHEQEMRLKHEQQQQKRQQQQQPSQQQQHNSNNSSNNSYITNDCCNISNNNSKFCDSSNFNNHISSNRLLVPAIYPCSTLRNRLQWHYRVTHSLECSRHSQECRYPSSNNNNSNKHFKRKDCP